MKMPKRFLYAAVLPLCGFIGYSFFSYYAFGDEAGELELNFWLVLEIVVVNFYCLIYLPLSFFLLKNVTLSKFLYVLYVLVSFVLNFLYLAFIHSHIDWQRCPTHSQYQSRSTVPLPNPAKRGHY